jgi:hypothetical protein
VKRNGPDGLRLRPEPSRYLFYWLVGSHGLALIALWLLQSSPMLKLLLLMSVVLFFSWSVRRYLLGRGRYAVQEAWATPEGDWHLHMANGDVLDARLAADSFVKPWLMVLRFHTGGFLSTRSLVLFPDSLDEPVQRNLRVYLKRSTTDR